MGDSKSINTEVSIGYWHNLPRKHKTELMFYICYFRKGETYRKSGLPARWRPA